MNIEKLAGSLSKLPQEIYLDRIAPYCNKTDLSKLGLVNNFFRLIFYSNEVWEKYISKNIPNNSENIFIKFLKKYFKIQTQTSDFKYKKILTVFYKNLCNHFFKKDNKLIKKNSQKFQNIFDKKSELDKIINKEIADFKKNSTSQNFLNESINKEKKFSNLKLLAYLEAGAKPDKDTLNLVLEHVENISKDILKLLLLKYKVKPDKDTFNIALQYIALPHKKNTLKDIFELLFEHGAEPNEHTLNIALHYIASLKKNTSKDILKLLLLKYKAKPNEHTLNIALKNQKHLSKDILDLLLKYCAGPNKYNRMQMKMFYNIKNTTKINLLSLNCLFHSFLKLVKNLFKKK